MSLYWEGFFRGGSWGGLILAARSSRSVYSRVRPVGLWTTFPASARHLDAGAFHLAAAAAMSISLAAAPARRKGSQE